jgi:hypothetical protein
MKNDNFFFFLSKFQKILNIILFYFIFYPQKELVEEDKQCTDCLIDLYTVCKNHHNYHIFVENCKYQI